MADLMAVAIRTLGASGDAAAALANAADASRMLDAGEQIATRGETSRGIHVVLAGMLKSCRVLDNGLTQTLALFTPGQIMGLQGAALGRETATLTAVTVAQVALIPQARLRPLLSAHPEISESLWRAVAREATILQEWMVGMGRRPALSQIAHLLCETAARMRFAGRAAGDLYDFPLTQIELADAVGLSPVHVNRLLQSLRNAGLIELGRGQLRIRDWAELARTADFDLGYLGSCDFHADGYAGLQAACATAEAPSPSTGSRHPAR